jgi:hypothetical protein
MQFALGMLWELLANSSALAAPFFLRSHGALKLLFSRRPENKLEVRGVTRESWP